MEPKPLSWVDLWIDVSETIQEEQEFIDRGDQLLSKVKTVAHSMMDRIQKVLPDQGGVTPDRPAS